MSDRFSTISITPESKVPAERRKRTKPTRRPRSRKTDFGPQRPRHWLNFAWFIIPFVLIALYGAWGFLLAPAQLTKVLSGYLLKTANVELSAGEAHFNPFTLRLQLRDLVSIDSPQNAASAQPLLQIESLLVKLNLIALLRNNFVSSRLAIEGLSIDLIRQPNKSYNLPEPVRADQGKGKAEPSLSSLSMLYSLNNITIRHSRITFDDRVAGKKHQIEQIKLDLPNLSNYAFEAQKDISPHFSAIINGSPVELSGEATLPGSSDSNGRTNLACNVQDIDLPFYFAYLPKSLPLVLSKGTGNGKIHISFTPTDKKGDLLTIGFQLTTTGMALSNTEQTLSITAPIIELQGNLQPLDGALQIHHLHIRQPQLSADPTHFPGAMAQLFANSDTSPAPAEQKRSRLKIDSFTIDDGTLQFINSGKNKENSPSWRAIQLAVKNFIPTSEETGEKGSFTLSSQQEKTRATLDWQGSFSKGIPGGILQLNNMEVSTFLAFIDPVQAATASGSANLHGYLSLDPTTSNIELTSLVDATVEIHDLVLHDQNKPWLSAKKVTLKGPKLQKENLELDMIRLEESSLTLEQNKLPAFFQVFGEHKKTIKLQELVFSGNAILYAQQDRSSPLQLTELQIKASKLMTSGSQHNLELTATINQTGTVTAHGLTTLYPLRTQLSLVFNAINSELVAPWLPALPLFQQSRTKIDGQGTFHYPDPSFTGTVQLGATAIQGDDNGSGLAFTKAELKDILIRSKPLHLDLNELILDRPQLTWQQETDSPDPMAQASSFLRKLVASPPNQQSQSNNKDDSSPSLIKKISIKDGTIRYMDQRLTPPWSAEISQLNGQINNLSAKADRATSFDLAGQINTVPFSLAGTADLLQEQGDFTANFVLTEFPIQMLAEQITPLLDLNPDAGHFDLAFKQSRQNKEEQAEATLLFTGLRPATAQAATALPLALLADNQDHIQLLIPLAANQVLFKETITTLRTMIVKAEVAPLLLTGAEFADLQHQLEIKFPPGLSELQLSDAEAKALARFAALLAMRPRLGLTLTGMADPIQDRAAIVKMLEEKEKQRVTLLNERRLQDWQNIQQQQRQTVPEAPPSGQITEKDIPRQELAPPVPLSPEPVNVADTNLHNLAQERALQVYDFFTADLGITSDRLMLQEISQSPTENTGNQVVIGFKYIEQAEL